MAFNSLKTLHVTFLAQCRKIAIEPKTRYLPDISELSHVAWLVINKRIIVKNVYAKLGLTLHHFYETVLLQADPTYITPKCKVCGEPLKVHSIYEGFYDFKSEDVIVCSSACYQKTDRAKLNRVLKAKTIMQSRREAGKPYGFVNSWTEEAQAKRKATNLARYGYEHSASSPTVKARVVATNEKKYGAPVPFANNNGQQKSKNSTIALGRKKSFATLKTLEEQTGIAIVSTEEDFILTGEFDARCSHCNHNWRTTPMNKNKFFVCPECNVKVSRVHRMVTTYLDELGIQYTINDRLLINPYELDIVIPSQKIAIEINGNYWHSEAIACKDYHQMKTELTSKVGYKLIHLFEGEIIYRFSAVKNILQAKLTENKKIFARKTSLRNVDAKTTRDFLETHHLQGAARSSLSIGLFRGDELLSVLTIAKARFSKKHTHEIIRFATKSGIRVVGGFSKLLKCALNQLPKNSSVVTYADRRFSDGDVYIKNGFIFDHIAQPCQWFCKGAGVLQHRSLFQKHLLHKKLTIFDPTLTAAENIKRDGWMSIWDAGHLVFTISN